MENRLRGLLALMLCFILTVAPIAGAMAEDIFLYDNDNDNDDDYPILLGDLISSEVRLTSRISGGVDFYTEGLYDPGFVNSDPDSEYPVSTSFPSSSIPVEASEDYEADLWAAANMFIYDVDNTLSLERVNKIVRKIELGDNVLLIMNGLQTIDSVNKSIEDRRIALEDAAKNWEKLVFYQMGVYAKDTPVEGVKRRVEYNGDPIKIPLDYPDQTIAENWEKYDFALFHMNSNAGVEQIECNPSPDGISFYASSFSPYALAYKLKADDDGDNGDGGEGDGGEGDGGEGDGGEGDGGNGDGGTGDGGTGDGGSGDGGTGDGGEGGTGDGGNDGGEDGSVDDDPSSVTDLPKTGDNSNLMLWIVLSVMALAGVLYIARRRENA